jgi:uncharacterized Tic20 family protein
MSTDPQDPFTFEGKAQVVPPSKFDVGMPTEDERTWALIAHLSGLIAGVVGLPFLGPLVVWMMKKDESAFVGDQAKEALNFQLAVLIASLICLATCILSPLVIVVAIGGLVYSIIGAMEANKGVLYRYPYTIRLIK